MKGEQAVINNGYPFVENVEGLTELFNSVRTAQKEFATYSQEQVDKIFLAAASAANRARILLAKSAVSETGMGIVEDKVIKNHYASEYIYNAYKSVKTCGVLEEDKAFGIKKVAEPIGVVAAVIPTTNPTSTAIFKILLYPLALSPKFLKAFSNNSLLLSSILQYFSIKLGVSSAFE